MVATDITATSGRGDSTTFGESDPLMPGRKPGQQNVLGDKTGRLVVRRWKLCANELMKQRRDYWQNLAMYFGEQWVWWDSRRNMLQALPQAWSPLGKGRARTVANRVAPNLMSLLGRMLRNDLEFDVPPTDSADDVVSGAMLAEDVLAGTAREQNWRQIRFGENFAKFLGGTSAVCVEWDPAAGIPLGQVEGTNKIVGTGDVRLHALSIGEFGIEPGIRDERKARWWVQGLALAPEAVRDMLGLKWTPVSDASVMMSPLQTRLLEHLGRGQGVHHLTLLLTMYEKPNRLSPRGHYAVVVNGTTVHEGPWPFPDPHKLNLFIFRQQAVEGTWIGRTLMNDAVPLQVQYNFMRSCIAEHAKKVGNARLMAPQGSFIEEDLSDDPGSVLWYTPDLGGTIPQYLRPPDLPRWMVGEAGALSAELDDVMFVHATSRGEASFDRASGQALALLAEKDDSPLGLMAFEESQGWAEIGEFVLKLYERMVTETRIAQAHPGAGQPGQVRISRWNGAMLKGQTRALVPLETTLPVSQAAQQAFARDMWDRGLIKDPVVFARMLRLPQRELMGVIDADVWKAQRENVRMSMGHAIHPALFDDHAKHIAEHNRDRKSDSYIYASDTVRKIKDYHIEYHEKMAAEQLGRQTQLASMNPALAALPQADEPTGSQVPMDFAESQAGQQPALPPGAPAGALPSGAQQPPQTSPALAAGANMAPGGR